MQAVQDQLSPQLQEPGIKSISLKKKTRILLKVRMCVNNKQVRRQLSSADLQPRMERQEHQPRMDYGEPEPYMSGPVNGDIPRSRMLSKRNSQNVIEPRQECSPAGRWDRRDRPPLLRNRSQSANPMQSHHHPYYGGTSTNNLINILLLLSGNDYPPPDVWSAEPYHKNPYMYDDPNMRPQHQGSYISGKLASNFPFAAAALPPERPKRRFVGNPDVSAHPTFDQRYASNRTVTFVPCKKCLKVVAHLQNCLVKKSIIDFKSQVNSDMTHFKI